MQVDIFEGYLICYVESEHYHSSDPLYQNIVTCFHNTQRVEPFEIITVRIIKCRKRPLTRTKPGVEDVRVAVVGSPFDSDNLLCYTLVIYPVVFIVDIAKCRYRYAPGDLS